MVGRVVIWMGDLNYRISDLSVDVVKVHIESNDLKTLMEHDQVRKCPATSAILKKFGNV